MILHQIARLNDVWKMLFMSDDVFYFLNIKKYLYCYYDHVNVVFNKFECEIVRIFNNGFIINDSHYLFDNECCNLFGTICADFQFKFDDDNLLIRIVDLNNNKVTYAVYSLFNGVSFELNENEIINPKFNVDEKSFISFYDDILILYNIEKNGVIWQQRLDDLMGVEDIDQFGEMIAVRGKLFICVNENGGKRITIVFDLESGVEVYRTSDFKGYIRLQKDKIYALYGKSVSILDPDTYQIRKVDLSDELAVLDVTFEEFVDTGESIGLTTRRFKFSPTNYEVHYPYLYFAQERGAQVGIVNLETEKLEWHTTIDIDYPINPVVKDIKACEGRLYVHCADNTLYVFERE